MLEPEVSPGHQTYIKHGNRVMICQVREIQLPMPSQSASKQNQKLFPNTFRDAVDTLSLRVADSVKYCLRLSNLQGSPTQPLYVSTGNYFATSIAAATE